MSAAQPATDAATLYRDTLNTVRLRLLTLSVGRNPAEMRREAEYIANMIRTRLDTPQGRQE